MKTILVAGGNSGVGRQAAAEFAAAGHRVVILGRSQKKGDEAIASFGDVDDRVTFYSVDLATHDGVRHAADLVKADHDMFDAIVHTTGVMTSQDIRTSDGLHPFFTVNYLSRYHLTQLLLPTLRRSKAARVVMMTANIPPDTQTTFDDFPEFTPYSFVKSRKPIQLANLYYAAQLVRTEPGFRASVVNAGGVKTDIFRMQPLPVRLLASALGPLAFDTVEKSASNVVQSALSDNWSGAIYLEKPGKFDKQTPFHFDATTTDPVMNISRELTGA